MDDYLGSFSEALTAAKVSREVDEIHKNGVFPAKVTGSSNDLKAKVEFKSSEDKNQSIRLGKPKDQVEKTGSQLEHQ